MLFRGRFWCDSVREVFGQGQKGRFEGKLTGFANVALAGEWAEWVKRRGAGDSVEK